MVQWYVYCPTFVNVVLKLVPPACVGGALRGTDRAVLRRGRGPGDDDAGHGAAVRVPRRHAIRRGQGITEIPVLLVATAFHQLGGHSRCARPRAAAIAPAAARYQ